MTSALLQRWPYLCQELSHSDAIYWWKHKIRMAFKNLRRRSALKENIEVKTMKEKYGKRASTEPQTGDNYVAKKRKDIWGVPNFLPDRLCGEDDHTLESYKTKLCSQAKLTTGRRNQALIEMAMAKTFPDRRKLLIVEMKSLNDIFNDYPILLEGEQVIFHVFNL